MFQAGRVGFRWPLFAVLLTLVNLLGSVMFTRLIGEVLQSGKLVQQATDEYDLMLSVPFYIYEELGNWLETGYKGNQTFLEVFQNRSTKHNEDVLFYKAALRHPMRTHQPEEAKLFVVPFLSSIVLSSLIYSDPARLCINNTCGKDLMVYLDQFLAKSKWFQRNEGNDHLLTVSFFGFNHPYVKKKRRYTNLMKCHVIQWGEEPKINIANRLMFNTFYVGSKCPLSANKTSDLAMVASLRPGNQRFQTRRDICAWIKKDSTKNYSMPICGPGPQCPALAEARFGFHTRGDTYGPID